MEKLIFYELELEEEKFAIFSNLLLYMVHFHVLQTKSQVLKNC